MSYPYEGTARTQAGKVIYRRKVHRFVPKDCARILFNLEGPTNFEDFASYLLMLKRIKDLLYEGRPEGAAKDPSVIVQLINELEAGFDALFAFLRTEVEDLEAEYAPAGFFYPIFDPYGPLLKP